MCCTMGENRIVIFEKKQRAGEEIVWKRVGSVDALSFLPQFILLNIQTLVWITIILQ